MFENSPSMADDKDVASEPVSENAQVEDTAPIVIEDQVTATITEPKDPSESGEKCVELPPDHDGLKAKEKPKTVPVVQLSLQERQQLKLKNSSANEINKTVSVIFKPGPTISNTRPVAIGLPFKFELNTWNETTKKSNELSYKTAEALALEFNKSSDPSKHRIFLADANGNPTPFPLPKKEQGVK